MFPEEDRDELLKSTVRNGDVALLEIFP